MQTRQQHCKHPLILYGVIFVIFSLCFACACAAVDCLEILHHNACINCRYLCTSSYFCLIYREQIKIQLLLSSFSWMLCWCKALVYFKQQMSCSYSYFDFAYGFQYSLIFQYYLSPSICRTRGTVYTIRPWQTEVCVSQKALVLP